MKDQKYLQYVESANNRLLRILSEYLNPQVRFAQENIYKSITIFGSARTLPKEDADKLLEEAQEKNSPEEIQKAQGYVKTARYYEECQELARLLTQWTVDNKEEYYICSGGGHGIMEAANRGAADVPNSRSIGLNIDLPFEQESNKYITPELNFDFRYFFMRKFWFTLLAKTIIIMPGGFGTLDELFEILTLIQTQKKKPVPIILYGKEFWNNLINFDYFLEMGMISPKDLDLFVIVDTPQEAFSYITQKLKESQEN